ncbi:ArsR family transcriptional regulator [Ciceribacter ferrooxidans]|uniref:ArsR family transcriptional regulator n=2 Tax=Ciceribacter ferrooxidans TaxID=2509717 RepID=A0A4V1RTS0_9HYPH|nr:ArsR family transcriptional regulator [Ciceribacter ferrooxidans]
MMQPSIDLLFHALADPSRRKIIERLSRGPATVSELARPLDMSLPAVVQHLQLLEASGIVTTKKIGRVRTCSLDAMSLSRAEQWLNERRNAVVQRLGRLGEYLESTQSDPKK